MSETVDAFIKPKLRVDGLRPEDGVDDMTQLSDLDVDGINTNLLTRYKNDLIYTYSGSILVAVNPYKRLGIYEQSIMEDYIGQNLHDKPPHVFAIADVAYRRLRSGDGNQSCVISGESGAGKTETTKYILQYLCGATSAVTSFIEQQIIETNIILEAFGNARTIRNDNSSRFGKFMQICFDDEHEIRGSIIQEYLLEQSRITFQAANERNYHVFYQLLKGGDKDQFALQPMESYKIINQSGVYTLGDVDDGESYEALRRAMTVLQIDESVMDGILSVVSAVLHIGNLTFIDNEESVLLTKDDKRICATVGDLMGLPGNDIEECVLTRQIIVRGDVTTIHFNMSDAQENRNAMAKALYSRTFTWLVSMINNTTNPGDYTKHFIGVLDIFGFENFATNSFEQLCINFTNEKLHKFFNHYVFDLEQAEYEKEGIKFDHITFTDNTECLDLIEKPPKCVLRLLDEECRFPKGTDQSYLTKQNTELGGHSKYIKGSDQSNRANQFGIEHFAGEVIYTVDGFLTKNKDVMQDLLFEKMRSSSTEFVRDVTRFQNMLQMERNMAMGRKARKVQDGGSISRSESMRTNKAKPTVGDTFRRQLAALVDVLESTTPWYVRCIKPNSEKRSDDYDKTLVRAQLLYSGMLDIVRIRREGFPIHVPAEKFVSTYQALARVMHQQLDSDPVVATKQILKFVHAPETEWQIGKTKVFLRNSVFDPLQEKLSEILQARVLMLQKAIRGWIARKEYLRTRFAVIRIQAAVRGAAMRWRYLRKRRAAVKIQAYTRGMFARQMVREMRKAKKEEDERRKKEEEERRAREAQERGEAMMEESVETAQKELFAMAKLAELQAKQTRPRGADDVDSLFSFLNKSGESAADESYKQQVNQELDAMFGRVSRPEGARTLRRKKRVQKQLHDEGLDQQAAKAEEDLEGYVMEQFAERHFNLHPASAAKGTFGRGSMKRSKDEPPMAKADMVRFTPASLMPMSLVHMHNPENNALACSIWKDLNKQFRGDLKDDFVIQSTQSILAYCLERPELRDEVYCQTIRQATDNPSPENTLRCWQFMCVLCVTFAPGKQLYKYALAYFRKTSNNTPSSSPIHAAALWCHDAVRATKLNGPRRLAASSLEINAIKTQTLVPLRIYFLDGQARAFGVHPCSTSQDLVRRVAQKLGLDDIDGWALYETTPQSEHYIRGQEYVGDILAEWEAVKRSSLNPTKYQTMSRGKGSGINEAIGEGDARLVFKKRLFKNPREIPRLPQEYSLVYSQALHSVVFGDEFPIGEQVALQLAGLQAQVSWGEPDASKKSRYEKIEAYICFRLRSSVKRSREEWVEALFKAHQQFGAGKSDMQAKILYLTAVKQYKLYGGTFFDVQYKGFWSFPARIFLTVHVDGFKFVHPRTKEILLDVSYKHLESVEVNAYEDTITLNMKKVEGHETPLFMFYTPQKEDIASLIASYSPQHRNWKQVGVASFTPRKATDDEKARFLHELRLARRRLAESGLLKKPEAGSGRGSFLSTTLRRKKGAQQASQDELDRMYPERFWAYSKSKLSQPLTNVVGEEAEDVALRLFNSLLVYAKLASAGGFEVANDPDHYVLVQNVIGRCLEKEDICNEFYLQLVKQTTDQPDPNSSINVKNWSMLALTLGVVVPRNKLILNYVMAHLRKCSLDASTEEGKYAQFCLQLLNRTVENKNRKYPPSTQEIQCVTKRRPIYARFYFMDGEFRALVFDPAATTAEVVSMIKDRLGLTEGVQGFSLFEVFGNLERNMLAWEKVADAIFKWEKFAKGGNVDQQLRLTFKKRLFLKPFVVPQHPIEFDLIFYQALDDVRGDRFPVSNEEAAYLAALRAQVELGDLDESVSDYETLYSQVMEQYLPKHLRAVVLPEDIAAHHRKLRGVDQKDCNMRYVKFVQQWHLYGATIFEVMQSYTSSLPKNLWLAVNEDGIHIMRRRAKEPIISYQYKHIVNYSPSLRNLMIVTESVTRGTKYVFNTSQGSQIAHLIKDYTHIIIQRRQRAKQGGTS